MSHRWSFEEDYVVCKFSFEYAHYSILECELFGLMRELEELGFVPRSEVAVLKRIRAYQQIFADRDFKYATNQIERMAEAYLNRQEKPLHIENVSPKLAQASTCDNNNNYLCETGLFEANHSQMHHLKYLEPAAPSFKELLLSYMIKSGMDNSEIYKAAYISRDKFNHIINGRKGKNIKQDVNSNKANASHRTVMQLCLGLKLSYEDAVYLMSCANYAFNPSDNVDRVVVACIKEGIYNMVEVNIELYKRNLELFKEPH